jgi:hypothetical protein
MRGCSAGEAEEQPVSCRFPRPVRVRRISAVLAASAAIAAGVLAGCGGDDDGGGDVDVGPAAAVPAGAPVYVDASLKPTGAAEANVKAALTKVLDTGDPGAKIVSLIDQEGQQQPANERFTYAADIEPWLGEKTGFFFTDFAGEGTGAAVVETTDPAGALASVRKSESGATQTSDHGGTTVYTNPSDGDSFATVGDFLVFGDAEAVNASIDANGGDSLGDDGEFKDALEQLPGDRLGTFYTLPRTLIDSLPAEELDQQSRALFEKSAGEALDQPVSGALTASENSFDLEFTGGDSGADTPESALVGDVPADSWLALGLGNLGETARRTLDQLKDSGIPNFEQGLAQVEQATGASIDQLTGALGDAVIYVRGTTEPTLNGALVVQTKDPDLTGRLLSQLQSLVQLGSQGGVRPLQLGGGGTGFQINDPSQAPQPIEIAQQGDKLIIGYGANSAAQSLAPTQKLSDSPAFSTAKGQVSDLGADFFLDFPKVFQLAESEGAKSDPGYLQAKPYLAALTYLVTGSGTEGDQTELKAVLGLR